MVRVADDSWFRLGRGRGHPAVTAAGPLRRELTDLERQARTDFAAMDASRTEAVDKALAGLAPVREDQIRQIVTQIRDLAVDRPDDLSAVTVDEEALADALYPHLVKAAEAAAAAQQSEAEQQGVTISDWTLTAAGGPSPIALTAAVGAALLRIVSRVTARLMSSALIQSAIGKALSLVGRGALTPDQVADQVQEHLQGLSDAGPRDAVDAAVSAAQNEGRRTVLAAAPPATAYVSTEILDMNVCDPCLREDGTVYSTLDEAVRAYPAGGYVDCLGGARCRGTYIATWDDQGV